MNLRYYCPSRRVGRAQLRRKVAPVATQPQRAGPDRSLDVPVRFTPLGSPWRLSKRSYVHVPGVPHRAVEGGLYSGVPGVWCGWVGTGRGIPGGGGVLPSRYPVLVLPGPNQCPSPVVPCPPGTPGSLQEPSAHLDSRTRRNPPPGQ